MTSTATVARFDLSRTRNGMKRGQLAICIADPISRRLVEGIAAQLELEPVVLDAEELSEPGTFGSGGDSAGR